jgi:putative flippase GtrA
LGLTHRVRGLLSNRFVRFLLVGGINTVFGYGVFALALYLGFHYALAAALSTVLGILFNFKTTGTLVFDRRDNGLLVKFLGVYGFTYVLGVLCLKVARHLDLNLFVVGAVLLLPMAGISFMLNWLFVFGARE